MTGRSTELVRIDSEMAQALRWLARHEKASAERADRKPKTAAQILKDLAGDQVSTAYQKIAPWVKSMRAAMARAAKVEG